VKIKTNSNFVHILKHHINRLIVQLEESFS